MLPIVTRGYVKKYQPSYYQKFSCANSILLHRSFSSKPPKVSELIYDVEKQRELLNKVIQDNSIKTNDEFYNFITKHTDGQETSDLNKLLPLYQHPYFMLTTLLPEKSWLPWGMTKNYPDQFWTDVSNQRKFMQWAASQLNVASPDDWYRISISDLINIGGDVLIKQYNKSLYALLTAVFPEHRFLPWKIKDLPVEHWNSIANQRELLDWIGSQLKINNFEQWYNVSSEQLHKMGGTFLLRKYFNSRYYLFNNIYAEYDWFPWRFERVPEHYFETLDNQRKFLNWIAGELKIQEVDDWYNVTWKDLKEKGAGTLLNMYGGSPAAMLSAVISNIEWLPWKFSKPSAGYWDNIQNKRTFLSWASKQLKINEMSDWYKISRAELSKVGGSPLFRDHHSMYELMVAMYPKYSWEFYKFPQLTSKAWETLLVEDKNKVKYVEYIEKELGIKEMKDWGEVKASDLDKVRTPPGWKLGKILSLANYVYPSLDTSKFKSIAYKKTQYLLKNTLNKLFPYEDVLEEYKHPDIVTPLGKNLEVDFFYPKLKLAIEFQGIQHFGVSLRFHSKHSLDENKKVDTLKQELCLEKGITFLEIPYWWDRKLESLAATIYSIRPDIFFSKPSGTPIPPSPHSNPGSPSSKTVTDNKLMTATFWSKDMNPTGWWMSEKFDGARIFWDGSAFYTRQGHSIPAPESKTMLMPSIALDGELWTQYGLHQQAVLLCKNSDESKWENATVWVFDAPEVEGPFEKRVEYLKNIEMEGKLPSFVKVIDVVKCEGREHLKSYFNTIIAKGGEGVMLREPQSLYKEGASLSMRKYKEYFDAEVKVLENRYPHGFYCQQTNGKELFVGINDNYEEAKIVRVGSIITVKHTGTNAHGTFLYPKFFRERTDVSWDGLINR